MDKNGGIQVARAIAALSVAYFHSYVALRGFPESAQHPISFLKEWGFLGVNLFFAISGYVICLIATRPHFTLSDFVIKRIFRLYPMYWVAMALVAALIALGKYRPETLEHFLYSMTMLPQQGPAAYDVSWTLERELVFYALAALSIPFAGIYGLAALLLALTLAGWHFGDPWSFHVVSTMQSGFLGGVVVFLISQRARIDTMAAVAFAAAGVIGLGYTRSHDFAFSAPIFLSLALLGIVNMQLPWRHPALSWAVKLGDASYSIYLLHGIVFSVSAYISGRIGQLPQWMCEPWRFATLAACCFLSFATWKAIELPVIGLGNRLVSRRKPQIATDQIASQKIT